MNEYKIISHEVGYIDDTKVKEILQKSIADKDNIKKVLLIPPDITRKTSGSGKIVNIYYQLLKDKCEVHIMPAIGSHEPMSNEEINSMYGTDIPKELFIEHNWEKETVKLGEVSSEYVESISNSAMSEKIDIEVNKRLISYYYDLIISIGQVLPHEVVGMANYSKNIFVGCGGKNMIDKTHLLGAFYGMDKLIGRDFSPVRKVYDIAEEKYLSNIPLMYVFTVTRQENNDTIYEGIFIGRSRKVFEDAVELSQKKNIIFFDEPLNKVVTYLDPIKFKSTWIGNKAVYRTKYAIKDGGELIVLAPGIKHFGENNIQDELIRKYGYVGRNKIVDLYNANKDLQDNSSITAHLIHGSSDSKFSITYAVKNLSKEDIEKVNFKYMDYEEAVKKYNPDSLKEGFNILNGEEIYYINNPAAALWICRKYFK